MSQPANALSPSVLAAIALGSLALGMLVFWSRPTGRDLREWTPADHDQPAGQAAQGLPPRQKGLPEDPVALAEMAWGRSCVTCHGEQGRGDGPQGPMVRAPDLTSPDWQGRVGDDDIRNVIKNGRNNMPKFDLPPAVLDALVKRIRGNRAN